MQLHNIFTLALTSLAVAIPVDTAASTTDAAPAAKPTPLSPCDSVRCGWGTVCEVIDGAPVCVPPYVPGVKCGEVICGPRLVCCNPVMSICVKPGQVCIL